MSETPVDNPPERRHSDGAILAALEEVRIQLGENNDATRGLSQSIDGLGRVTEMAARTARAAADQSTETAALVVHTAEHTDEERAKLTEEVQARADSAKAEAQAAIDKARRKLIRNWTTIAAVLTFLVVIGGLGIVRHSSNVAREQNARAAGLLQQRNQIARTSCEARNAAQTANAARSAATGQAIRDWIDENDRIERDLNAETSLPVRNARIANNQRLARLIVPTDAKPQPLPNCAALYPNTHP